MEGQRLLLQRDISGTFHHLLVFRFWELVAGGRRPGSGLGSVGEWPCNLGKPLLPTSRVPHLSDGVFFCEIIRECISSLQVCLFCKEVPTR